MMKKLLLIALVGLLTSDLATAARRNCRESSIVRSTIVAAMTPETSLPLSRAMIQKLEAHPLAKLAANVPGRGRNLIFSFRWVFGASFRVQSVLKGEGQQTLLIRDYLKYLFPEATFQSVPTTSDNVTTKVPAGKNRIEFFTADCAERPDYCKGLISERILHMPVLKAGNPGRLVDRRSDLRKGWGIATNSKIVHLYMRDESYVFRYGSQVVSELVKSLNPDVIIVSLGFLTEPGSNFGVRYLKYMKDSFAGETVAMSKLTNDDFAKSGKLFIANETSGLMPQIHAVSDVVIVVGPKNFIQPLNVGTKTVSLMMPVLPSDKEQPYDIETLNSMIALAQGTGGFIAIRDIRDFSDAMLRLDKMPEPESPAFTGPEGQSAIDRVLDMLDRAVRSQLPI